ncbi:MAG: hypothetical protein KI792_01165 [Alphaproteobacteria bacterium]|nr:hypothetical protein [Alphaproteobacteria bacterium SS10]
MSFVFSDQAVEIARGLNKLYRNKAPVITMAAGADPVRAEDVIDPRQKIGPLDTPLVLAVMAAKDPFEGMSLAASVRMMPGARDQELVGAIVGLVGEVSRHEIVQETCDTAIRQEFAPAIVTNLRDRAVTHIDNVRQVSLSSLVEHVRELSESKVVDDQFIDELFSLAFRCDLRTDTFRDMLVKVLLSNKVRARVKLLVIDRLHLLPMQLRLELVTKIDALADGTDSAYIRREIEFTLKERGLAPPTLTLRPNADTITKALPSPMKRRPSRAAATYGADKPAVPWHEVLLRDKYANLAHSC